MSGETPETVDGIAATDFESVAAEFAQVMGGEPGAGAALAVVIDGELVVDLWAGQARSRDSTGWSRDTASVIFSCTKGLVAILAARLVAEGELDYDAPVTRYWPEFGRAGKGGVLVRHLLAHRAGLSAPRVDMTLDDVLDWDRATAILAAQRPLWTPGTGYSYHALTYGWLVGEVIRRVTGTSVGQYFANAIARPLRADAWIGLPDHETGRVAELEVGATLASAVYAQEARARRRLGPDWNDRAMTLGGAMPLTLAGVGTGFNRPDVRAAEIPGAGAIATARALATIWCATVAPMDDGPLLGSTVLARALAVQSQDRPVFDAAPPWAKWGMGFELPSPARRMLGAASFGHAGAGGQLSFADRTHRLGFAFLTNRMEAGDADRRADRIVAALDVALARIARRR